MLVDWVNSITTSDGCRQRHISRTAFNTPPFLQRHKSRERGGGGRETPRLPGDGVGISRDDSTRKQEPIPGDLLTEIETWDQNVPDVIVT